MGDSSINNLYEIFSKMFEQQQQPRSISEALKHTLEPNPVKLRGPENYISWARHTQLILSSHGYESLLVGDKIEVKETNTRNKQTNDRVLVWLLGSMEPIIREQVETITTVQGVWSSLESQFSGKSNKMQANSIIHELSNLKQGSRSVTEYAGEVSKLYRELHYYHPFEPVAKRDLAVHHAWFEPIVSRLFLDGLNEEFELRRQLIFSNAEWPSLDNIISSVVEEETRLAHPKVENYKNIDVSAEVPLQTSSTVSFPRERNKGKLFSAYCRYTGHIKEKCYKSHGYPPRWNKGRNRTGGSPKLEFKVESSQSQCNYGKFISGR